MKLSTTHAFNCIVLMVKFGQTSCEDIPPALLKETEAKLCAYSDEQLPVKGKIICDVSYKGQTYVYSH